MNWLINSACVKAYYAPVCGSLFHTLSWCGWFPPGGDGRRCGSRRLCSCRIERPCLTPPPSASSPPSARRSPAAVACAPLRKSSCTPLVPPLSVQTSPVAAEVTYENYIQYRYVFTILTQFNSKHSICFSNINIVYLSYQFFNIWFTDNEPIW